MTEENKIRDVVDAVTGVAKAVPVYQDLVQPAAQEIGKSLQQVAKTVHVALAPISLLIWGYEQIREFVSTKVTERLKNVPLENIVMPSTNIACPVLEALRYTGHESALSDLYANLLAASMDSSTAHKAHPAFVEIIKQLTPDEAKIISSFVTYPSGSLCHEITDYSGFRKRSESSISEQWDLICASASVEHPSNNGTYLDNLIRLRLIFLYHENKSELIPEGGNEYGSYESYIDGTIKETLYVTEFGERFISACTVKNKT